MGLQAGDLEGGGSGRQAGQASQPEHLPLVTGPSQDRRGPTAGDEGQVARYWLSWRPTCILHQTWPIFLQVPGVTPNPLLWPPPKRSQSLSRSLLRTKLWPQFTSPRGAGWEAQCGQEPERSAHLEQISYKTKPLPAYVGGGCAMPGASGPQWACGASRVGWVLAAFPLYCPSPMVSGASPPTLAFSRTPEIIKEQKQIVSPPASHSSEHLIGSSCLPDATLLNPILQIRVLKHKEVKKLAPGHSASEQWNGEPRRDWPSCQPESLLTFGFGRRQMHIHALLQRNA